MKSNITPSTKVTYPATPDIQYGISRMRYVEETGVIESLDILRKGYGHVFSGTVEQAEAEGFIFHVEPEVTVEEVNDMLGIEPLPLTDLAELVAEHEQTIALLRAEIDQQRDSMETLNNELSKANGRVESFRNVVNKQDDTVTEWAKKMVEQQKLRRADANVLMDALNIANLPGKYSGTVIFLDGSRIENVLFEADDEDGWKDRVRDSIEIGTVRVKYEVTIDDEDTPKRITVDEDNSDYSPDENDSWIDFEDIEEVE
jgi:hypothetical protein